MKNPTSKDYAAASDVDLKLTRLLRAAAKQGEEVTDSPPFGFETRVVAQWRAGLPNGNGNGLSALIRRVVIAAAAIIVVSTSATIYAIRNNRDRFSEPLTNEFALAEYAIQDEASQ